MANVTVVDYQLGNLHSVEAACKAVGLYPEVTQDPRKILQAKGLILPGVGAFPEAMSQLKSRGLDSCVREFVNSQRPVLGVCLGMQLLLDGSEEFGGHEGLGLIRGQVRRFDSKALAELGYPVPQVGWNQISEPSEGAWRGTLLESNQHNDWMYFVHSFFADVEDRESVAARTTYGNQVFCSAVRTKNLFATQFHPEKSGSAGLKLYGLFREKIELLG